MDNDPVLILQQDILRRIPFHCLGYIEINGMEFFIFIYSNDLALFHVGVFGQITGGAQGVLDSRVIVQIEATGLAHLSAYRVVGLVFEETPIEDVNDVLRLKFQIALRDVFQKQVAQIERHKHRFHRRGAQTLDQRVVEKGLGHEVIGAFENVLQTHSIGKRIFPALFDVSVQIDDVYIPIDYREDLDKIGILQRHRPRPFEVLVVNVDHHLFFIFDGALHLYLLRPGGGDDSPGQLDEPLQRVVSLELVQGGTFDIACNSRPGADDRDKDDVARLQNHVIGLVAF